VERLGQERKILEEIKYGLILGSDKFVNWIQKRFINQESVKDKELPQQRRIADNGIVERVLDKVGKEFGIEKVKLLNRKRRIPNIGRDVSMYILKIYTGLDNKKIGNIFGVSLSGASKAAMRVREQMRKQKELKKKVDNILYSIIKLSP
jgi:chromosomal replication initiation ATPase DnaA